MFAAVKKAAGASIADLDALPSVDSTSAKVHALTDAGCAPVTMIFSAGQAGDNPYLLPLIDLHETSDRNRFHLLADKAYSHPPRANC